MLIPLVVQNASTFSASSSALAEVQHLMLVNVVLVLLIVGFTGGIVLALVRRSVRERLEAARLAAMGTATARILHQVKNPLQTILLHAEMLEDDRMAANVELRREICQAIVGEALRMTELLSELSAYAAGVGRRLDLQPMPLDVLVRDVAVALEREGREAGFEVRVGPLEEVSIAGDVYFLRQALGNVVRNACEAVADWSGDGEAVVEIALRRRGAEAVIEVRDNGPGVDPERMVHIFEPFVTSKPKGMGLGLPICREIIEGHGGRIELRSRPSAGTVVQLILPVVPAARSLQPA